MKKFLCFLLTIICSFGLVSPAFSAQKTYATNTEDSTFVEDLIINKTDIVSEQTSSVPSATASQNKAPFNTHTEKMMSGYSIKPHVQNDGEQNFNMEISPFVPAEGKSVFLWIYFPEVLAYDLTISFSTTENFSISWTFDSALILNILDDNGKYLIAYGWKLFELDFQEADLSDEAIDMYQHTFTTMNFSYLLPDPSLSETIFCEGLSFYHVFMGDSFSSSSSIAYYQKYANFKVKEDFAQKISSFYIGDSFKFYVYDVFEYVVVGNNDLLNFSNLSFTWFIVLQYPDEGIKKEIKFGETYTFEEPGYYSMNFKLVEGKDATSSSDGKVVLNTSYSFDCENFTMGAFPNKSYFVYTMQDSVITYKASEDFCITGDFSVFIDNSNVATVVSYEKQSNTYYIKIQGLKQGNTKLTVSATGYRVGHENKSETFVSKTTIYVNKTPEEPASTTLLMAVFIGFCAVMVVFVVISFVKARKIGVK